MCGRSARSAQAVHTRRMSEGGSPANQRRGDTVAVVNLHDGWNIISNPTDRDVSWSWVKAMHSDTPLQMPWKFDGTYQMSDNKYSWEISQR